MSGWQQDPLLGVGFVGILLLFFGLQDLILMPPGRRDAVSGVLWIAAGIWAVCLGVAQHYGHPTAFALFVLLLATGLGAVVRKMIGLAGLWGKPQPIPEWQKNLIAGGQPV